ncbi:MAG: glycosyltransferase [Myxococcales bacterium]|nr:MAG: glycosyltransferase [Myxococcales bacterium]
MPRYTRPIQRPLIRKTSVHAEPHSAEEPRISIVVPSYQQGKFLERTLLSVIQQDYPNKELIVMDGGSTDESVDIIKRYEREIFY